MMQADRGMLETVLFRFLKHRAGSGGGDGADLPLTADAAALEALTTPSAPVMDAFRHCLDDFLTSMGENPAGRDPVTVTSAALITALLVYNHLAASSCRPDSARFLKETEERRLLTEFSLSLAADTDDNLCRAAVLAVLPRCPPDDAGLSPVMGRVLDACPLACLDRLDVYTPGPLRSPDDTPRPADSGPGGSGENPQSRDWGRTVAGLLRDPLLARWARHRWLYLPDTRRACRNRGRVLELLRRHGGFREFLLEFYEAYDHFRGRSRQAWRGGPRIREWPLLDRIEPLLRFPGDSDFSWRVVAGGKEYFESFLPLLAIIRQEGAVPPEYRRLSPEFYHRLRFLHHYLPDAGAGSLKFGPARFADQDADQDETGDKP